MKRLAIGKLGVWLCALSLALLVAQPASADTGVTVGKEMPAFSAIDLNGQTVQVAANGTPYVLNFWATWCPPCREEFPELNQFAASHAGTVQFYAIDLQESADTAGGFLRSNGYQLPVLLDLDGSIAATFKVRSIPTTLVVDGQGVIRFRKLGGVTAAELNDVLNSL